MPEQVKIKIEDPQIAKFAKALITQFQKTDPRLSQLAAFDSILGDFLEYIQTAYEPKKVEQTDEKQ